MVRHAPCSCAPGRSVSDAIAAFFEAHPPDRIIEPIPPLFPFCERCGRKLTEEESIAGTTAEGGPEYLCEPCMDKELNTYENPR